MVLLSPLSECVVHPPPPPLLVVENANAPEDATEKKANDERWATRRTPGAGRPKSRVWYRGGRGEEAG